MLPAVYTNRPGVGAVLNKKGDAPKNAKVSDVCFDLRITNHWIACIPRQRHSNRPLVLSCHACRGSERDDRGGNGAKSEMKWTRLAVCFILSCKYESRWKEWRSLCLLNYFYCSEKKNKEKKIRNGRWCLTLLFSLCRSHSRSLSLWCVFLWERPGGHFWQGSW